MLPITLWYQRQTIQLPSSPFLESDANLDDDSYKDAAAFGPQRGLADMQNDIVISDQAADIQYDFFPNLANEPLMPCSHIGASSHSLAQAAAVADSEFPVRLSRGQGSIPSSSHDSPKLETQKSEICSVAMGGDVTGDGEAHMQGARAKPKSRAAKGQPMPHKEVPKRANFKEHFDHSPTQASAVTTLMIRNVPNKCDRAAFMAWLDNLNFKGQYNFVYLPIDSHTRMNVGFTFVNFDYPEAAQRCMDTVAGTQFTGGRNESNARSLRVSVAHLQGLEANMAHYRKTHVLSLPVMSHRPWVRKKDARLMRPSRSVAKSKIQVGPASKDEALATASPKPTSEISLQVETRPDECSHFLATEQAELDPRKLQQNMDMLSFLIDKDGNTAVDSRQMRPLKSSECPVRNRQLQEHHGGAYTLLSGDEPMKVQPLSCTSMEQLRFQGELQPGQKPSALDVLGQFLRGSGRDVLKEGPVIDEENNLGADGRLGVAQVAYQIPSGLAVAFGGAADYAQQILSGQAMGDFREAYMSADMPSFPAEYGTCLPGACWGGSPTPRSYSSRIPNGNAISFLL